MKGPEEVESIDQGWAAQTREPAHPRAVGAPLPAGGSRGRFTPAADDAKRATPPLGRTLVTPEADSSGELSNAQRAMNVLKMAMPLVQKILPLLDGNFGTAISNIMAPQSHRQATSAPAVNVNLEPVEHALAELQTQHTELTTQNTELREQMVEQNTSLKRVEDQLEMVREATDRNTLEQQELLEDLKAVGTKVNLVAIIALSLLFISVFLNLFLFLQVKKVLP